MIAFKHVSISVQNRNLWTDFSFTVKPGQKVVITGPSGCGKSSLIKATVGLMRASGTICIDQIPLVPKNMIEIRRKLAFIGQEPLLSDGIVIDALREPFTFKSHAKTPFPDQKVDHLLKTLTLNKDILKQSVNSLSGGEKQRLCILRALLLGKKIFLLDEVTSALDNASKTAVIEFFLSDNDYTILSVAHDKEWIERCDEIKWQEFNT